MLENITRQTMFEDSEVIILNCQNIEHESELYATYLNKYNNIHEIKHIEYLELFASWNVGLRVATAPFVCVSNTSDSWRPDFLECCATPLTHHRAVSIMAAQILLTDEPCQMWPDWQYSNRTLPFPYSNIGPCPIWRRSLHHKYGYFDEHCATIDDMLLRWWAGGERFDIIPEDLILHTTSGEHLGQIRKPHSR